MTDQARRRTAVNRSASRLRLTRRGRVVVRASACAAALALGVSATAYAGGGVSPVSGGGDSAHSGRYAKLWNSFSRAEHGWAHKTSQCESGQDPKALGDGGRYRGAFMFTRNAWKTSPKSPGGDPIDYTWQTQAVVAIMLKHRDGTRPWPVCG